MKSEQKATAKKVAALKVYQWLQEWNKVGFDERHHRKKPPEHFYIFSMSARDLKTLTGIYRRSTAGVTLRSLDLGIQRRHDVSRSDEIRDFVRYGYPWSELSSSKRQSGNFNNLQKPGWLPTAIVINILRPEDVRHSKKVDAMDLLEVAEDKNGEVQILLPQSWSTRNWKPKKIHPIEVIDGQHRLWAFEGGAIDDSFQLPVVAFHGLDISWQAYLFWSINIKPKRINASLAFDLYPLLRTEDWLERFDGHSIYRETRAQELVETIWAHPESPWYQRVNMLGEPGLRVPMVTQAAWIRSLMATYIKSWEGRGVAIGGLFGAPVGRHKEALPWSRAQQAAFIILVGQLMRSAVSGCHCKWTNDLRKKQMPSLLEPKVDLAFLGAHTLLNTDQGIRGVLYITNDLCYLRADELKLDSWTSEKHASAADEESVTAALRSLRNETVATYLDGICHKLSRYDWRTSSATGLSEEERIKKAAFRGSGGYKELRRQLLFTVRDESDIGKVAGEAIKKLGYA